MAATAMLVAAKAVNWPWALTVAVNVWLALPYDAADTPVLAMLNVVPIRDKPVPALYVPAPENCVQGMAVTPIVPVDAAVVTHPVFSKVVPDSINVNAPGTSDQVFMSAVRVQPLALAA